MEKTWKSTHLGCVDVERATRQAASATEEQLFWLQRSSWLPNKSEGPNCETLAGALWPCCWTQASGASFLVPPRPITSFTSLSKEEPVFGSHQQRAYNFFNLFFNFNRLHVLLRPFQAQTLFISTAKEHYIDFYFYFIFVKRKRRQIFDKNVAIDILSLLTF